MTSATAWRLSVLAGLIAFVCSWGFGQIPGLVACGSFANAGRYGPILAFELARTPADIAALFGDGACRARLAHAQDIGLWLDASGFIPSYTAFLSLAAIAASAGWRRSVTVALLLVAGLSDEIEGIVMWRILGSLPGTQSQLDALWWAVHVKFALLAVGTLFIGLSLIRAFRLLPVLMGLIVAVGGAAAVYGFLHIAQPIMMPAFTYAWFALLATAIVASLAPGLFAGRRTPSGL